MEFSSNQKITKFLVTLYKGSQNLLSSMCQQIYSWTPRLVSTTLVLDNFTAEDCHARLSVGVSPQSLCVSSSFWRLRHTERLLSCSWTRAALTLLWPTASYSSTFRQTQEHLLRSSSLSSMPSCCMQIMWRAFHSWIMNLCLRMSTMRYSSVCLLLSIYKT
jgi:hypothetical protein